MTDELSRELIVEIEAFRADLRRRSEEHQRRSRETSALDLPMVDVTRLELPQMKAIIAQRYGDARTQHRLRDMERRLATLEAERG